VSLILEALRKLDREKQTPERGMVVLGPTAWARDEGRRRWVVPAVLAVLVLAAAFAGVGAWMWFGRKGPAPDVVPPAPAGAQTDAARGGSPSEALSLPSLSPGEGAAAPPFSPVAAPPATTLARGASRPATGARAKSSEDGEPSGEASPAPAPDKIDAQSDLVLQAVAQLEGVPVAIVNGRLVREGDSYGGVLIVRIGAAEVEVEIDGKRRVVGF
jgi:hypothetical protein